MFAPSTPDWSGIVVGVDGSPGALRAVRWATEEAVGRRLPLRLVFAVDPLCQAGVGFPDRRVAESAMADAAEQAREVDASAEIVPEIVLASPATALVGLAGRAAMICLGSNGARPAHPGHHTSTATEVILTADCPVTVVRGPVPRHGWAVARVEPEPFLFDVLDLAVAEAAMRNLPLRLLTNWDVHTGPSSDARDFDLRLRRDLDRWRSKHPRLDAVVVSAPDLDDFLSRNAARIALFVGSPRLRHDVGTVVDSSVESAVRLLDCPLIIGAGVTASTDGNGGTAWSLAGVESASRPHGSTIGATQRT
ncbi:MAG: universal stress protein [Mycobacterium sp.]